MSTKIKLKTVGNNQELAYQNDSEFLPKFNLEVILIEIDDKLYEVMEMEHEKSNDAEVDNVITYHIREIDTTLKP